MTIIRFLALVLVAANWTPDNLDPELLPIAFLESSNGLNINHKPHSKGEFYSSYGALGLKPATAYDEYVRSSTFRNQWPGLRDSVAFTASFKDQPALYNAACNFHWRRIRSKIPSLARAVFAWRWGYTAAIQAKEEQIASDTYVISYLRIYHEQEVGTQ